MSIIDGQLELGEDDGLAGLRAAWAASQGALASKFAPATYDNFLRSLSPLSCDGRIAVFGAQSSFAREWAEKKYTKLLTEQFGVQVRFVVKTDDVTPLLGDVPLPLQLAAAPQATAMAAPETGLRARIGLDRNPFARDLAGIELFERFAFDGFLTGRSNELAYAGAVAVASTPGALYNPLYLYGGAGLGKTHLMHAIGHQARATLPSARVAYTTGESFTNHYVAAIREKRTEDFRRAYRGLDIWLVDDIQLIATREQTKEEFSHTFDALRQNGKQVVITADRPPRELSGFNDRLRSRFESGLVADIGSPDTETRARILALKATAGGFDIPDDVVRYMAELWLDNICMLEGALIKLMAHASMSRSAVTRQYAIDVLGRHYGAEPETPAIPIRGRTCAPVSGQGRSTVDQVIQAVSASLGIDEGAIRMGGGRDRDVAFARQTAMYLARELTGANTILLASAFNVKNHSTISHAHAKARRALETDAGALKAISDIKQSFRNETKPSAQEAL